MVRKKVVQDIFIDNFEDYNKSHKLTWNVVKAARRIMKCRTVEMGGHAYECPSCHSMEFSFNSCKHRSCPQCSGVPNKAWLETQSEKILKTDHYHVIFTIPDKINPFWLADVKGLNQILFESVNETLNEFLNDEKYLGAQSGRILTLHTWSSVLDLHPHIHCLISAGGLKDGKWVPVEREYLFPVVAVSEFFRGRLLLKFKKYLGSQLVVQHKKVIEKMWSTKWNVFILPKYDHASGVIKYLANYIKGGPLNPKRIVHVTKSMIAFRYRKPDRKDKSDMSKSSYMTLPIKTFIQRFLLHIPPAYVRTTRYYGLYAPRSFEKLNEARILLGQKALTERKLYAKVLKSIKEETKKMIEETILFCNKCNINREVIRNLQPVALKTIVEQTKPPPIDLPYKPANHLTQIRSSKT